MSKLKTFVCVVLLLLTAACAQSTGSRGTALAKTFVLAENSDMSCALDSIGNMILTGKVSNTSPTLTLQFVELRGSILDPGGKTMNTDTGYIDSDKLGPKQSSTYSIYVKAPRGVVGKCAIEVEDARFAGS